MTFWSKLVKYIRFPDCLETNYDRYLRIRQPKVYLCSVCLFVAGLLIILFIAGAMMT
jgi:hypothetical protein